MSITVLGSINIDLSCSVERPPNPGETIHGHSYTLGLGGKGCNQAVAARRLGGAVTMLGAVGEDLFAQRARAELAAAAVATDHILTLPIPTGIAVISVDRRGENQITVIGGANMALQAAALESYEAELAATRQLLVQLEIPLEVNLAAMQRVREHGGRVIFDPAPMPSDGLAQAVLQQVDIITPNEVETGLLLGQRPETPADAEAAARALHARGVGAAVVKLGGRGVGVFDGEDFHFIPPFRVEVVDTVAAGDCFNGGLAFALDRGESLASAVRFAAACGALATTRPGASAAAPTLAEVEELLASQSS